MGRLIKVIHFADKFGVKGSSVHGVSRLFSWWLPRFDTNRFEVHLYGLRPPGKAQETLAEKGLAVQSLGRGRFDVGTLKDMTAIIRREGPDILHLHGYGATTFGRIAALATGVKTIVHEHFVDPAIPKIQAPFDFVLGRFTHYGIAVSRSVGEFMVKQRHIPKDRVEVIFNGAPLREFNPLQPDELAQVRRQWEIPDGCPVVGTIGRLDEQKGNRYLVQAAAYILEQGYPVKLMIVGDGPLLDDLQLLAQELGIAEDVIFPGYQSDIPRIQSIMDIQAFPSLWEGTPLTLFEAMSMGRTIVSTSVDGLGEVLEDGRNALLVPERESQPLAEAIIALLQDPDRRQQLADQALSDSRQYSIARTVERMQDVYERLADASLQAVPS